jgi:cob(I)alamin adenosyltransferase
MVKVLFDIVSVIKTMAIYTKRGDRGDTGMFDESRSRRRIAKDSLVVEALGSVDELNSFLGIAKEEIAKTQSDTKTQSAIEIQKAIGDMQRNLLTIGSITGGSSLRFTSVQTKKLEAQIDHLEGKLPVLKNFIIPGGSVAAAHLQYARALARRTERRMVALSKVTAVKPQILEYLNRLSDAIFMLARHVNHGAGIKDEVWVGRKK